MSTSPECIHALAEALSPLSHSLAAGLLVRPAGARDEQDQPPSRETLHALYTALGEQLKESVPAVRSSAAALCEGDLDELDEIVDELAAPALELIDISRRIWQSPLPAEMEAARPLLATIAEAPVTALLQWILEIMHTAIDPWAVADDPEQIDISYPQTVEDTPLREALARWRSANPGALPEAELP